jgi:hypothetical protein
VFLGFQISGRIHKKRAPYPKSSQILLLTNPIIDRLDEYNRDSYKRIGHDISILGIRKAKFVSMEFYSMVHNLCNIHPKLCARDVQHYLCIFRSMIKKLLLVGKHNPKLALIDLFKKQFPPKIETYLL